VTLREGVARFVIFEEEHRELGEILSWVCAESRAKAVLLVDTAGQLMRESGNTAGLDMTSFCTLAASNIAATASMARLMGENDFTILFHQGKKDSLHISLIGHRVILVVIFGSEASLGLVRLRVRKAAEQIEAVVQRIVRRMGVEDRLDLDPLGEITEQDIDELFSL
jgi:predicted regulator of Ras-like GTPase activity (Roadblock/LC7/MglB family)